MIIMTELATAITADEFKALDEKGKIAILAAEKQAELDRVALDELRGKFYQAMQKELAAFDEGARERIGTFTSGISEERTLIEMKWKAAESKGAWEMPV
jgi:hypothetical protein